ncbi:MAG TPA: hypothetical protein VET88_01450, partial [Gammaproteobacteria bacterium]|nr:hypothetical protein [Gammaproteobacteria bacterium]
AKGFVLSERIDEFFAEFLANCEKSTTVGQAVTATERAFKRRINRDEFVSVLRDFVLKGFLIEA